ncbi:hypothetical protein 010DV004_73 [Bacillus phage 010DV004]|nr:hypothetical protein 010DV004_73 [Bacillus phage 010DV004]QZA69290.1 hypothetical protein 010DV005_73 [Bacillus phage 010DV005]QZA69858.1 hypothetical protein 043JT007_72 [Bacillus phage 043JT007]
MFKYRSCPICNKRLGEPSKEERDPDNQKVVSCTFDCKDDFHSYQFKGTEWFTHEETINGFHLDPARGPAFRSGVIAALKHEYLRNTQLVFCFAEDAYVSKGRHEECNCEPKDMTEETRAKLNALEKESKDYLNQLLDKEKNEE